MLAVRSQIELKLRHGMFCVYDSLTYSQNTQDVWVIWLDFSFSFMSLLKPRGFSLQFLRKLKEVSFITDDLTHGE